MQRRLLLLLMLFINSTAWGSDFDVDNDGVVAPLTDGLLVLRHFFGFTGTALTEGALGANASNTTAELIQAHINDRQERFDLDGDGLQQPLTDGLLLLRLLFGFTGEALTQGALGDNANRRTSDSILEHIESELNISLVKLEKYADQTRPSYIGKDNTSASNPITDAGATLGRVLFYDTRLSRTDSISCSACHQQALAFSDQNTASIGINGTTERHSMRLINTRFSDETRFFWDERATSLEAQTTQPIQDHIEMGFSGTDGDPSLADLIDKLATIERYPLLFAMAFGDSAITEPRLQSAFAQFIRSIESFDAPYDVGRANHRDNQDFDNFTAAENRGKRLFMAPPNDGGAGCAGCHRPPEFDIDPNTRNNGVIAAISGGIDLTNTRSPTLRDLVNPAGVPNGGLMHNGAFESLEAVVEHYNRIPEDNSQLDQRLRRPGGGRQNLNFSDAQKADLVDFLKTLTGSTVYTDSRWSNPFAL
jgi:cytochrome c peroxidase